MLGYLEYRVMSNSSTLSKHPLYLRQSTRDRDESLGGNYHDVGWTSGHPMALRHAYFARYRHRRRCSPRRPTDVFLPVRQSTVGHCLDYACPCAIFGSSLLSSSFYRLIVWCIYFWMPQKRLRSTSPAEF